MGRPSTRRAAGCTLSASHAGRAAQSAAKEWLLKHIVVIGAGGHARVVADIIRLTGEYRLRGFIDGINPDRHDEELEGSRVLGGYDMLDDLITVGVTHAAIAIGDNDARLQLAQRAFELGYTLPVLAHKQAIIAAGVLFEPGCVVCAGAVLNPGVQLGAHVIINTAATVDHDSFVDTAAHIGPGAHLAGHVRVGRAAIVGIGAAVISRITIGDRAIVGAGAAVVHDVAAGQTVVGVPARPLP